MFKSLRVRLTVWFVSLCTITYLIITLATGLLFHYQLSRAIDYELTELLAENLQNVHYQDGQLTYTSVAPTLSTKPIKMLASIQLFDANEKLVHSSGAPGVTSLFNSTVEMPVRQHHLRSKSRKLVEGGKTVGYLQVQLPTDLREQAETERVFMLLITAPFLLCLLYFSGYYFTTLATKPVERAFAILKDFMSQAGHELNTPLSIAQAALDNLGRSESDPQTAAKVSVIGLSIARMRSLVDDLIVLAKLDYDKAVRNSHNSIPLHQIVTETLQHIEPLLEERNISLHVNSLADAWVEGNYNQLQQMITNLLQNAINYNQPNGSVFVELRVSEKKALLTVSDTGIGIPTEYLNQVFERFFRVDTPRSRETGGSGLGLSIVKAVVDSHKGTIDLQSKVGEGTRFTVALPTVSRPAATHAIPTESL